MIDYNYNKSHKSNVYLINALVLSKTKNALIFLTSGKNSED